MHIFSKKFEISSLDADYKCRTKVSSLVNFFIQAALHHAEKLGWGYTHLGKMGLGWVFSRFMLRIDHIPMWPGQVNVETWAKGMDRLFYVRDAELFGEDNRRFAALTSSWLLVDKNSRRPKLHHPESEILHENKDKHAINKTIPTLQTNGEYENAGKYNVRYSDIDLYQHLTTVRYVDLLFDTYDLVFMDKHVPKEVTVNFLKEIPYDTEVTMKKRENGNIHYFELLNGPDTICFKGEVKF